MPKKSKQVLWQEYLIALKEYTKLVAAYIKKLNNPVAKDGTNPPPPPPPKPPGGK